MDIMRQLRFLCGCPATQVRKVVEICRVILFCANKREVNLSVVCTNNRIHL